MRPRFLAPALAPVLAVACALPPAAQETHQETRETQYSGAFVTRLGADTIAIEAFERDGSRVRATTALRVPRTRITEYELRLDDAGHPVHLLAETRDPLDGAMLERTSYDFERDSVRITMTEDGEVTTRWAPVAEWSLPFLDMLHWPYELVLRRAAAARADSQTVTLLQGTRPGAFVVRRQGQRSYTIRHPFRGTMAVETAPDGALMALDASATTRKLAVERVAGLDVEALAREFARRDAAGGGVGPLSGRGESSAVIDGATVAVDYGRPSMRGRDIFGGLVPWGEVWRTGANEATHLTTDRELLVGETRIPAGRYTLFTLPQPDSWQLIVNRRVDIGGTAYDPQHDLARIPMRTRSLDRPVELFTMEVADTAAGAGELRLRWDTTEAYVPIRPAP